MNNKSIATAVVALATIAFSVSATHAAVKTWNNAGTDFNTAGDWTGGLPGTADNATFAAAATVQPNVSANISVLSVNFSVAAASGYNLTSSGTAIKLTLLSTSGAGASAALNAANTSGTNTINAPLVLGAAAASTQTFSQAAGGALVVNGIISSTNSLTLSMSVTGASSITLNGANTYTGATNLTGASIVAGSSIFGIGNDSAFSTGTLNVASAVTLTASGAARNIANNTTWAGSAIVAGSNDLTFSGSFTSSGAAGRAIIVNNTGLTTLSGNVFLATDNAAAGGLTINGSGSLTISGVIANNSAANTNAKNVTISTTGGTTTLTNANTYTGTTTLSQGTLSLGNKQVFGIGGTVGWNGVSTSASTNLSGANAIANTGTFGGNNTFTGTNSIELSGGLSQGSSTRTTTNNMTGGAILTYSGNMALSASATNTSHIFNGSGNTTVSGIISNGGASTSGITESGTGKLTLTNTNTYTGNTSISGGGTVSAGTLGNSGANSNIGAGTAINFGNTTTTGTLLYTGSGETTTKAINLAGSTGGAVIDQSGAGLLKFTANVTAPGLAATDERKTLTLQGSTGGTGEISGNIVDSTLGTAGQLATSVTKQGSGTWTLSGTNTYTGLTNVTAGTLVDSGSIADTSDLTVNGGTAVFDLGANHSDTVAAVTLQAGGSITGSGSSTLTGSTYGVQSGSISAKIGGSGAMTKSTAGTVVLTGDSSATYTGATAVNQGVLVVNGSVAGSAVTVAGGTLSGSGTVGSVNVTSGTLAPGTSPGILNTGNLSLSLGSVYLVDINGSAVAGVDYDQTNVTGTVTLTNPTLTLNFTGGYSAQPGDYLTIINNDSGDAVSGTFNGLAEGSTIGGYTISYIGGDGNDVILSNAPTAVPEPSTWLAAALSLGAIGFMQRRRLVAAFKTA